MKRRLPLGVQDFAKLREDGFLYVDKTARVYDLLTRTGTQVFLSRPRRFGKSLLCSTIRALFEGRRELFSGLAVDGLDWDWKPRPVIHIDLNAGDYAGGGVAALESGLNRSVEFAAEKYGVPFEGDNPADRFARFLKAARLKHGEKVAVIVDEYDKPMLATIDDEPLHRKMRGALKGFYSVLKSSDADVEFVFLTGVTKFAQVSVFSDLNQLKDISLDPRFADLCGLTQGELERDFEPDISRVLADTGRSREEYLARLKRFYNGYRFSEKPLTVYNPFGLLNHFDSGGRFQSYWYQTGTPTFLITLIENQRLDIVNLENKTVYFKDFCKYDTATMQAVPVLYQSGYLTIADYDAERDCFTLDYPNEEVRGSFAESLLERYMRPPVQSLHTFTADFTSAVYDGDVDAALGAMRVFLSSIPYDIIGDTERYFQTVIHLIFTMFGLQCRSEVRIAAGRIDTLVETGKLVYCFEFKLDGSAEDALEQIDSKDYLLPWAGSGKRLFKVGVDFDRAKRNIGSWKFAEA